MIGSIFATLGLREQALAVICAGKALLLQLLDTAQALRQVDTLLGRLLSASAVACTELEPLLRDPDVQGSISSAVARSPPGQARSLVDTVASALTAASARSAHSPAKHVAAAAALILRAVRVESSQAPSVALARQAVSTALEHALQRCLAAGACEGESWAQGFAPGVARFVPYLEVVAALGGLHANCAATNPALDTPLAHGLQLDATTLIAVRHETTTSGDRLPLAIEHARTEIGRFRDSLGPDRAATYHALELAAAEMTVHKAQQYTAGRVTIAASQAALASAIPLVLLGALDALDRLQRAVHTCSGVPAQSAASAVDSPHEAGQALTERRLACLAGCLAAAAVQLAAAAAGHEQLQAAFSGVVRALPQWLPHVHTALQSSVLRVLTELCLGTLGAASSSGPLVAVAAGVLLGSELHTRVPAAAEVCVEQVSASLRHNAVLAAGALPGAWGAAVVASAEDITDEGRLQQLQSVLGHALHALSAGNSEHCESGSVEASLQALQCGLTFSQQIQLPCVDGGGAVSGAATRLLAGVLAAGAVAACQLSSGCGPGAAEAAGVLHCAFLALERLCKRTSAVATQLSVSQAGMAVLRRMVCIHRLWQVADAGSSDQGAVLHMQRVLLSTVYAGSTAQVLPDQCSALKSAFDEVAEIAYDHCAAQCGGSGALVGGVKVTDRNASATQRQRSATPDPAVSSASRMDVPECFVALHALSRAAAHWQSRTAHGGGASKGAKQLVRAVIRFHKRSTHVMTQQLWHAARTAASLVEAQGCVAAGMLDGALVCLGHLQCARAFASAASSKRRRKDNTGDGLVKSAEANFEACMEVRGCQLSIPVLRRLTFRRWVGSASADRARMQSAS